MSETYVPIPRDFGDSGTFDQQIKNMVLILLDDEEIQEMLPGALNYYSNLY